MLGPFISSSHPLKGCLRTSDPHANMSPHQQAVCCLHSHESVNALECVHVVCMSLCLVPTWPSRAVPGSPCGPSAGGHPCPLQDALISFARTEPGGLSGVQWTVPKWGGGEPVWAEHGDQMINSRKTQPEGLWAKRKSLVLCLYFVLSNASTL